MGKIKIHIVEDHDMFREGIRFVLNTNADFEVAGESSNGSEFIGMLKPDDLPDVVLMDIDMPVMNGIEATQKATVAFPALNIITLSMHGDHEHYKKMIEAGAKGFVLKNSGIQELSDAIYEVNKGNPYFSHELLMQIVLKNEEASTAVELQKKLALSEREMDVLQLICKGLANKNIAEQLYISVKTVEGHKSKLMLKTETNNTVSLVLFAIKNQLILL